MISNDLWSIFPAAGSSHLMSHGLAGEQMVLKITVIANRTKGDTETGERGRVGLSYLVPSPS